MEVIESRKKRKGIEKEFFKMIDSLKILSFLL